MSEIIQLDFSKDILFWYETPKSRQVIDSLKQAIMQNIDLPLFYVFKIWDNSYSLSLNNKIFVNWTEYRDGGHHRAIASYEVSNSVLAILIDKEVHPVYMLQSWYIDITKIPVVDDVWEYLKRKKRYGNYL